MELQQKRITIMQILMEKVAKNIFNMMIEIVIFIKSCLDY